jgi:hypothetical protein
MEVGLDEAESTSPSRSGGGGAEGCCGISLLRPNSLRKKPCLVGGDNGWAGTFAGSDAGSGCAMLRSEDAASRYAEVRC